MRKLRKGINALFESPIKLAWQIYEFRLAMQKATEADPILKEKYRAKERAVNILIGQMYLGILTVIFLLLLYVGVVWLLHILGLTSSPFENGGIRL